MNVPILVTGGAGFIGSHACKTLSARGYLPISVDNLSRGHTSAVKWGPLEVGDLRDIIFLKNVFSRYQPVAVMHFAAFAYVSESMKNPSLYHDNNVGGAETLINVIRETPCKYFVFSSSCTVYGDPKVIPIAEEHPRYPVNPYGEGKHHIEKYLVQANQEWGLHSVSLRYFNAAGADPEGEIGESHDPETHAIPCALIAAAKRQPFAINGTNYSTPDGTCVRDYVHVSDLADAHAKALNYLTNGGQTEAFNLGTGNGSSVRDVIQAVKDVTGRSVQVVEAPRRAGDPAVLIAAAERAGSILDWSPRFKDLQTQVQHAWNWLSKTYG